MPSIRPEIIPGELYHVYNRSVEGRIVFPSRHYHSRFITAMRLFNTTMQVTLRDFLSTGIGSLYEKGGRLVDIGAFILMPTHYHFLLRPRIENGLSLFMQKIGTGFTSYFNLMQRRSGALFQGKYKVKLVEKDAYARYIQAYIPLNALDKEMPSWRENGITHPQRAREILLAHPWSSFSSYITENRFPGIIDKNFINDFFDNRRDYEQFVLSRTADAYDDTGIGSL